MAKPMMRALVLGVALAALAGCDRVEQLGQLTSDVLNQITGGEPDQQAETPVDPLAAAPVEARALFGVMQAPMELTPVTATYLSL